MKKIIYSVAAMALAFFSVSCQQENLEPVAGGTVTYTVQVPGAIATKAIGDDISGVTKLIYEVYKQDEAGNLTEVLYESTEPVTINAERKFTFNLEFIKNHNYTVLFWAYDPLASDYYITDNLRAVKLSQSLVANNEAMAVFAGSDQVVNCQSTSNGNVTLVRPVAQINVVTNNESLAVGTRSITLNQSSLIVKGLSTTYNVADKSVASEEKDFAYEVADANLNNIPSDTFTIGTEVYNYVAMNYVGFASELGDNVDLELTIKTSEGDVYHEISNIPVKPNYRTNIYGNLITASADYAVELKKDWSDPTGGNMEAITEGLIKNINGDYEVSTAKGLAYAINNLFVNANGVANAATFYVKPGLYDMAQQALNDITVTSGTLKIYDTEAVVTRSVTIDGVVITGLSKPLIQTVKEDATVFFSGITVKGFAGEDQEAALVQKNEGKVVLADCAIVDENGNVDKETELVLGNDPVEFEKGDEEDGYLIYTAAQLAAAFADEEAESIVLCADITLENTLVFPVGRTATLDLRGCELTVNEPATKYAINNHGTLTIEDSYQIGSVNARGIYNGYGNGDENIPAAKLIIDGGTFNAMGIGGGAAIFSYGEIEINGGKFTSVDSYSVSTQTGGKITVNDGEILGGMYNNGCEVIINDGKIEGNRSGCHTVYNYNANVTIKGGTFHNNNSGNSTIMAAGTTTIKYIGGTYSIKDGRVEGNGNTWTSCLLDSQNTATSEITGGTFNGGFRVQAGTSMTITGGSFNDCFGSNYNIYGSVSITGGTYTDDNAKAFATKYAHKDYKLLDETVVPKDYVAQIGDAKYETLLEAVTAVQDGETITLVADEVFTATNYFDNGGWKDGLGYSGDKSFTIDLDGHTISQDGALNDYLVWIKNVGSKENTITFKNGTMDAGKTAYCALCTASSHENKLTVNLENITLINENSNGSTVKIRAGSELNVKAGTKITGRNSYLGIENWKAVVNIYDGAEIYMNGTASYNGCLVGVGGNGTINVYGGYGKGVKGGFIAMTSGGTINVAGGEWIANTNGTVGDNSNLYVLTAQSNKYESGFAGPSIINVTGGTFRGGMDAWVLNNLPEEKAELNISGGNFNVNPTRYLAADYKAVETDGIWTVVVDYAAKIGETEYATLQEAFNVGGNITLLRDVIISETATLQGGKTAVLDLNGKTLTAVNVSALASTEASNLTVKNGKVVAYEATIRAIGGKVVVENGEYVSTGTALDSPATYRYSLDCREGGELIINGGTFKSNNGMINVGSTVTVNGGKFENIVEKATTRHFAYVSAPLTINDGEFYGKANAGAGGCFFCGAAEGGEIQVNGGKFTSLWTSGSVNRIFEVYYGGTINVTGGMFNTNGGIADFVTENTDEATKAAYPYVAK